MATTTATQTPILCPQCGTQVAILENLPQEDNNVRLTCAKCGLGLAVDTTTQEEQ